MLVCQSKGHARSGTSDQAQSGRLEVPTTSATLQPRARPSNRFTCETAGKDKVRGAPIAIGVSTDESTGDAWRPSLLADTILIYRVNGYEIPHLRSIGQTQRKLWMPEI